MYSTGPSNIYLDFPIVLQYDVPFAVLQASTCKSVPDQSMKTPGSLTEARDPGNASGYSPAC